jgi:ABC-2 type transport system permease protein
MASQHANANQDAALPRDSDGQIYRRNYTRYDGPREGRSRTYLAVVWHSVRRALGVRRKWTAKILPIILYSSAFVPVIGFISVPAILGIDALQFDTASLFSTLSLILLVFAAAASPEMLCDDRRENVLPLYYSRGMTRPDYLIAKLLALGGIMLSVSLLPAMLLFLGNSFLQDQPFSYFRTNGDEALRLIATSVLLSVLYASIGLAVASMTERKGVASAIIIGFFIAGTAIANGLFQAVDESWGFVFALISPMDIPEGILLLVYGDAPSGSLAIRADIDGFWFLASVFGFAGVSAALLYRRYLRED